MTLWRRADVSVHRHEAAAEGGWVLKDPVALRYFELRDEELAIWQMLDGRTSAAQIQRAFATRFAPLRLELGQILAFAGRLHQAGLLVSETSGQGQQLWEQHRRRRCQNRWAALSNPLAIRVAGFDPEPWLGRLARHVGWLFSPWFLGLCLLLTLGALLLAAVEFQTLQARLPDWATFLAAGNLLWLAVALALAKCLHELGHALACRHFGGECHEIGLLLLVFTPCLYCNVSDAWLFPRRGQRIAVSAAGIGVEVVLAAACLIVWWFTAPGLLNALLLNVVVVCSVNTLLFNGNPLMRFDGYYVLADLLGVSNLAQRSQALLGASVRRWFLDVGQGEDRSLPERRRGLLQAYALAAAGYRVMVIGAILGLIYRMAKSQGVPVLGVAVIGMVLWGLLRGPLVRAADFWRHPGAWRRLRRGRVRGALVGAGLALLALLLVPLPHRVVVPAVLQPANARPVFVTVPGRLEEAVAAGTVVAAGEPLVRLSNLTLERELAALRGRRDVQRLRLAHLRARQSEDPAVAARLPAAAADLEDVENRFEQRRRDASQLVVLAPLAGTLFSPPRPAAENYGAGRLPTSRLTPLDPGARGSHLEVGTLVGLIGDPDQLEALLVIDQSQLAAVRPGQRVRLQIETSPWRILRGQLEEVAHRELRIVPREWGGSDLPIRIDGQGNPRPAAPSYQARVVLEPGYGRLPLGSRGRAKIRVSPQPLAQRLYRTLRSLFSLTPALAG